MSIYHHTKMSNKILVIGAINIDITINKDSEYILHNSNVVNSYFTIGGVGANIARNLAFLGNSVTMCTPSSDEMFYHLVKTKMEESNVSLTNFWKSKNAVGLYINVLDNQNDLYIGFNDLRPLNPVVRYKEELSELLLKHDLIILDANLSFDALKNISSMKRKGLLAVDVVSVEKASRTFSSLSNIDYLKTNKLEFMRLAEEGFNPYKFERLTTIVTDGENDVTVYKKGKKYRFPVEKVSNVINVSGAGDAFFSGFLHAALEKEELEKQIKYAIDVANKVLLSDKNALGGK